MIPAFALGLAAADANAGIGPLAGYPLAYFVALQNAPAVEASLIDYLWPVLIILFSAALRAAAAPEQLSRRHVFGAAIAFAGAALAIAGGSGLSFGGNAFGYEMALAAAPIWSSYSVATRLFGAVPGSAAALYCVSTALLAWCAHASLERFVWPAAGIGAIAIVALGIGPLGLAFYAWDYGCKQGDLRKLGIAAHFAPVLSTALMTLCGLSPAKPALWLAAILITGGAAVTSRDSQPAFSSVLIATAGIASDRKKLLSASSFKYEL